MGSRHRILAALLIVGMAAAFYGSYLAGRGESDEPPMADLGSTPMDGPPTTAPNAAPPTEAPVAGPVAFFSDMTATVEPDGECFSYFEFKWTFFPDRAPEPLTDVTLQVTGADGFSQEQHAFTNPDGFTVALTALTETSGEWTALVLLVGAQPASPQPNSTTAEASC